MKSREPFYVSKYIFHKSGLPAGMQRQKAERHQTYFSVNADNYYAQLQECWDPGEYFSLENGGPNSAFSYICANPQ